MDKNNREFVTMLESINKKIGKQEWRCLFNNCSENAINSHLIQQNGLLSNITKDNHFIQAKISNPHEWDKGIPPVKFGRVGIKNALSMKIFCSKHDKKIFRPIEDTDKNFESYESFLLFSYRATSAEARKKEIEISRYKRILTAIQLKDTLNSHGYNDYLNFSLIGMTAGLSDALFLKDEFEQEISNPTDKYTYQAIKYPKFEVYSSCIISSTDLDESAEPPAPDYDSIYLHFLPLKHEFLILVGYHNDYKPKDADIYIDSWKNLNPVDLEKKITTVFTTNSENWGMSVDLFETIHEKSKSRFIDDFPHNINKFGIFHKSDFNLFEQNRP